MPQIKLPETDQPGFCDLIGSFKTFGHPGNDRAARKPVESSQLMSDSVGGFATATALAFIFTVGSLEERFALPLDPMPTDPWGYLSPLLRKTDRALNLVHTQAEIFVYPGFLYWWLPPVSEISGDRQSYNIYWAWRAGRGFMLTWRRLRAFVPDSFSHSFPSLMHSAWPGAAILSLASDTVRIETQLRPEGVCRVFDQHYLYFCGSVVSCSVLEKPGEPAQLPAEGGN